MNILAILTAIAGVIMCFGYFFQAHKIHKTKSSKDVSLATYLVFGAGIVIWLIYGISLHDYPIIVTNIVALIGVIVVLVLYRIHR